MTQIKTAERIETIFAEAGVTGFVYAREIGAPDGPEVSIGGDEPVVLASVFKIAVLVAFVRAVADGTIDPAERTTVDSRHRIGGVGFAGFTDDIEVSWRDLALNMMTVSDNAATDVLYHRLGSAAVDKVLRDLGLAHTRITGCCEDLFQTILDDLGATAGIDIDELIGEVDPQLVLSCRATDPLRSIHASTPRDVARLLEAIWTDTAASSEACAQAREVMVQQVWPHRLSSHLDEDVTVGGKTGTLPPWRNEAGVLQYPDGRCYAVTVFTRAHGVVEYHPAADAAIGLAGRAAVQELRAQTA